MNKKFIQNEKLLIGSLPENYLPRPHLLQLFNSSKDARIIFLEAPGGYGKTSSTIHWLTQQDSQPLWISLDKYDNLPTLFYKLCSNALLAAQPNNDALSKIVNHADFPSSPVEFMILALDAFQAMEQTYTIILDDFHFITNPKILKSLPFILKRLSLSTKIVLLSRKSIPNELKEHYGSEKINQINAQTLAFTQEEIYSYYNLTKTVVSTEDIKAIYTQTNGWPIAIQSMATPSPELLPLNQGGKQLAWYIEQQIWGKWSEQIQQFLMKIAIVKEMTSEIAELLTDERQSAELLQEISGQSMLLHKIKTDTYRFHDLFQEFLLKKLANNQQISTSDLYQRMTGYYLAKGDVFLARYASVNSQDEGLMITTLLTDTQYTNFHTSMEEYVDTVLKYQAINLPETIYHQEPVFHIIPAWYYFLTGQAAKMTLHLDQLLTNFTQIVLESPTFIEEVVLILGLDPRQTLLTKVMSISQIINLPERIPSPKSNVQSVSLTAQLPFLHNGLIDYAELGDRDVFQEVRPHFEILLQDQASQTLDCVYGGLQLEQNHLLEAGQYLYQAYATINPETTVEFYFSATMHLIHLHFIQEDTQNYARLLSKLEEWLTDTNHYYLVPNFNAYTSRVAIWEGNTEEAQTWLQSYYVTEVEQIEIYKLFQHFTTIRAHILLEHHHDALVLTEKILRFAQEFKRPIDEAEAAVLLAIIYWQLGNKKRSLSLLATSLERSYPFKFIRVYGDEGAAILPLLKKIKNQLNQKNEKDTDFQQYLEKIILVATQVAKRQGGILPPAIAESIRLSKQQMRMIELLAAGYKFNEIVELTNLSINTIRSHVNLAYEKLGVNNSRQAVLKAKELKIIP